MTQQIIKLNGYSVHIDICLISAALHTDHFDYALNVASEDRLRRIIGDLAVYPANHTTRINKIKARLKQLEKMNAKIDVAMDAYKVQQ